MQVVVWLGERRLGHWDIIRIGAHGKRSHVVTTLDEAPQKDVIPARRGIAKWQGQFNKYEENAHGFVRLPAPL